MHTSCVRAQTALAFLQTFWCWREKKARTYFLAAKPSLKSDRSHSQICMPCCSLLRAVQVGVPAAGRKRSTSGFTPICVSSQHEEPGRQAGSSGESWAVPQAGESLSSGATCLQSQTPSREGQSQSAGHSLSKRLPNESSWGWTVICRTRDDLIFKIFLFGGLSDRTLWRPHVLTLDAIEFPVYISYLHCGHGNPFWGTCVCMHTRLSVLPKGWGQTPFPLPLLYHSLQRLCLNSITWWKTSSVSTSQNQLLFLPLFEIAKQNSVYFNSWECHR